MSLPPQSNQLNLAVQKRAFIEQAVALASKNLWNEAIVVNKKIIKTFGEDAESLNRLGKAYSENGKIPSAKNAYRNALKIEPLNRIALRNLDRLAVLEPSKTKKEKERAGKLFFLDSSNTVAFIDLQAVDLKVLRRINIGDPLDLKVKGSAVNVENKQGQYLGMLAPKAGIRLSRFVEFGNTYEVALVSLVDPIRVAIREDYVHPSQAGRLSFVAQNGEPGKKKVRGYTRRSLVSDGKQEGIRKFDDFDNSDEFDDFDDSDNESSKLTFQEEGVIGHSEEDNSEF